MSTTISFVAFMNNIPPPVLRTSIQILPELGDKGTKTKDLLIYSIYFGFRYLHLFIILSGYNDTNTSNVKDENAEAA